MANRLNLQAKFLELTPNVYYQPPSSIRMNYPAIRYKRTILDNEFADDSVYIQNVAYEVTVIDRNPDSEIAMNVSKFPSCRYLRHYESEGLNHDVFIVYDQGGN